MGPKLLAFAALAAALAANACTSTPKESDPGAAAAAYMEAGRTEEAVQEIELAVRAHPENPALRMQAAEIYTAVGDTGKAVGHLENAVRLDPHDAELWILLGGIEAERENTSDAYVAFRRGAELAPDDLRAVSGLALAADQLGFEDEAEAAYLRWTQIENSQKQAAPAKADTD